MKKLFGYFGLAAALSVAAVLLLVASFFALDFVYLHFVVADPREVTVGDGLLVLVYSLLLGGGLVMCGFWCTAYWLWPKRQKG
jgi:hypothetical protein